MSLISTNQVWIIGHDLAIIVHALVALLHINAIHNSPTSIFRVAVAINNSLIGERLRKSLKIRKWGVRMSLFHTNSARFQGSI
jgi:hypothetical protein